MLRSSGSRTGIGVDRLTQNWSIEVLGLAKGPIDREHSDRRRLTQGTVRIVGGATRFELTFVTHWMRGEDDNDVKARVLQLAADRIGDLYDGHVENAERLQAMATLAPGDPLWSVGAATNDNAGVSANFPPAVWAVVDGGLHPLQAARQWRGMSLDSLAVRTGIAAGTIMAFEARRSKPTAEDLMTLAGPLRVRFHLLGDEED